MSDEHTFLMFFVSWQHLGYAGQLLTLLVYESAGLQNDLHSIDTWALLEIITHVGVRLKKQACKLMLCYAVSENKGSFSLIHVLLEDIANGRMKREDR